MANDYKDWVDRFVEEFWYQEHRFPSSAELNRAMCAAEAQYDETFEQIDEEL